MKPLTFADISTQALIDSINRYTGYINNTKSFEWTSCSICKEVKKKTKQNEHDSKACHLCPLFKDSWCRAYPTASRLNPRWHKDNDFLRDGTSSKERWMNDMENYVGLLTKIIDCRERTVDDCVIDYWIESKTTVTVHLLTETLEGNGGNDIISNGITIEENNLNWNDVEEKTIELIRTTKKELEERLK
jgi:hypothetical protein